MANSNIFSLITYWWMNDFFNAGSRRTINESDMFELDRRDASDILCARLEKNWIKELNNAGSRKPNLLRAIARTFGPKFALINVAVFTLESLRIVLSVLIVHLVSYFEEDTVPDWHAYAYAAAISATAILIPLLYHQCFFWVERIGWHMRASACALMYKKTLRLSRKALNQTTTGQIVNLSATDVIRFDYLATYLHFVWIGPLQCIVVSIILWRNVGLAILAGIGILVAITLLQTVNGRAFGKLRLLTAVLTDDRIRLMNEITAGIRIIKMYVWEKPFSKLVSESRRKEIQKILISSALKALNVSIFITYDKILTFVTLLMYVLMGGNVVASKVFLVVSLFDVLKASMGFCFSNAMWHLNEGLSTISRIKEFLLLDEFASCRTDEDKNAARGSSYIEMKNFCGKWDLENTDTNKNEVTLKDITFRVNSGELLAIIGTVGAGKSSFLNAILGELPIMSGSINTQGEIAYANQTPWVFSGTIRENILFGRPYDRDWYNDVISACCLAEDIKKLPEGDRTLVGERGATLSGGQKSRVNLARAAYQKDASICLLDDPLSAVDVSVASDIFDRCISGLMKQKVRVLVTHQLQLLKNADNIIILKKGEVDSCGTYNELQAIGTDFAALLQKEEDQNLESGSKVSRRKFLKRNFSRHSATASMRSVLSTASIESMPVTMDEFVDIEPKELREQGSISGKVYLEYFQVGANAFYLFLFVIVILASHVLYIINDWWLAQWALNYEEHAKHTRNKNLSVTTDFSLVGSGDSSFHTTTNYNLESDYDNRYYLGTYAAISVAVILAVLLRANMHFYLCVTSGINMHEKMFRAILRAPVRFFDTNPIGRVLNRFSKDTGQVDELLPLAFMEFLFISGLIISVVILVASINYFVIIIIAPLAIYFFWLRRFYLRTSRDIKRLEGICRSPVFSLLSSTLQGLVTIRAYGAEDQFVRRFHEFQDLHSASWFLFLTGSRWFGLRLDSIAAIFTGATAFACVIVSSLVDINAGEVGLILTYSASALSIFQWGVRQSTEVENLMTSVERIQQYYRLTPEAPDEIPEKKPFEVWPNHGSIKFQNVFFAYYKDGPVVLQNINLEIQAKEKIGLVGRTGAGKSSIISALFRLAELVNGEIYIDGIEISSIGLNDLRAALSIIPQDPVLFTSTMRRNLDPFDEYTDEDLWNALEQVQLREFVKALPLQLKTELAEAGSNFSVGQRQLVCLARAVLRRSKILLIDEAKANIDIRTDKLIQVTIKEKFRHCTVITIAHRINTIIDSDKVVVLDSSEVKEFDEPHILLQNKVGFFSSLVAGTGVSESESLRTAAEEAYIRRRRDKIANTNALQM